MHVRIVLAFLAMTVAAAGSDSAFAAGAGTISFASASYSAAPSAGSVVLTVDRSGGTTGAVNVYWKTKSGTAVGGKDYWNSAAHVIWGNGDAAPKTITVPLNTEDTFSGTRTFTVSISVLSGGATLGAISTASVNLSVPTTGTLKLDAPSYTVSQSAASVKIAVDRVGGSSGLAKVYIATKPGSAVAGTNYVASSTFLVWQNGDSTPKTFSVALKDVAAYTGTIDFTVDLAYQYGALLGAPSAATIAIEGSASTTPPVGTWTGVTPSGVNLGNLSCGNFGTQSVQVDPAHPSNLYAEFHCQGIWKSIDYGATWTGPINTGTNGASVGDCAGGIALSPSSTGSVPTIYESCIRGSVGFWKSVDGGVNWTSYVVAPTSRQDYNAPVIDPYDENHLLMSAHEFDSLVESIDGGQTWTSVPLASGMLQNVTPQYKTGFVFFINTGSSSATRGTWLWLGQASGGAYGSWRTSNGGAAWLQVDKNEQPGGSSQIYQAGTTGVVYMAGDYSALGWGVLRSPDFGQTWTHVGMTNNESVVVGTSNDVYAMFGYPAGAGASTDPVFEVATQPGTGTWIAPGTPAALTQGSAEIAVVNDGTHNILIGAMWNSGLWRYIEP